MDEFPALVTAFPYTTAILVNKQLPKDLASIVIKYFLSTKRDADSISIAGEYETCLQFSERQLKTGFYGACFGGHFPIVNLMISHGVNGWDFGFLGACSSGNLELAKFMISKGADDWRFCIYEASLNSRAEIVKLIFDSCKDENIRRSCFNLVCYSGNIEMVKAAISHGIDYWNNGIRGACGGRHIEIVRLMVANGAQLCMNCYRPVNDH